MVLNVMGSNPIGHPKKGSLSASFFASYGVRTHGFHITKDKRKVAEISLSDQILLFIVQREAIVDITGTLRVQR